MGRLGIRKTVLFFLHRRPGEQYTGFWTAGQSTYYNQNWSWNLTTSIPFAYANWCRYEPVLGGWERGHAYVTPEGCWKNGPGEGLRFAVCEIDQCR